MFTFPAGLLFFFLGVNVEETDSVSRSAKMACFQPVKFLVRRGNTPKVRAGGFTISPASTNAMKFLLLVVRSDLVDGDGDLEDEE